MEIDVEGRTWSVEEREVHTLAPQPGEDYCGLLFRRRGADEGEGVEMRWMPRPRVLTGSLAGRLLLLAGERLWRDRRTGSLHQVLLESGSWPGDEEPAARTPMRVRFVTDGRATSTAYDVGRPLALASDDDLETLLDRSRAPRPQRAAQVAGSAAD